MTASVGKLPKTYLSGAFLLARYGHKVTVWIMKGNTRTTLVNCIKLVNHVTINWNVSVISNTRTVYF